MIRKIALLIAVIMAIFAVEALAGKESDKVIVNEYDLEEFRGITADDIYEVHVTHGLVQSVRVEVSDWLADFVEIGVSGKTLNLSVKPGIYKSGISISREGIRIRSRRNSGKIKVFVTAPELYRVKLSGAASLIAEGKFICDNGDFRIELSGASNAKGLLVEGSKADIHMSGASTLDLDGAFDSVKAALSGASNFDMNVDCGDFYGHISGASSIKLSGKGDFIRFEGSGASNLIAPDFHANEGNVRLSGASHASVNVSGSLDIKTSGASSCTNKAR